MGVEYCKHNSLKLGFEILTLMRVELIQIFIRKPEREKAP
jgi:hypothetical protein